MSKQEPADQVKFLVSCIGHSNNGRPDFQAVADELEIVSKAAAQKRYERMLKAHGINRPGALANNDATPPATPSKRKAKAEGPGSATKRPARGKAKKEDDEEDVKPKASATKSKAKVKKEEEKEPAHSENSPLSGAPGSEEDGSEA
ncbi:hypothetical protein FHETE_4567 [Fusarium heterosporum]|uniref:Myb-like DNA-binding domain-containing protein n=1 Tax=Fusarium heterosporum TaxID=42747 RepID=A0A8H5WP98_FUSHE|nr:hypothetical protein FHETE_4567 [Fusarium heterosporum]